MTTKRKPVTARAAAAKPPTEGSQYTAVVRLTDKSGHSVVAMPGESCERVNPISFPWLLEQGLIVPKAEVADE